MIADRISYVMTVRRRERHHSIGCTINAKTVGPTTLGRFKLKKIRATRSLKRITHARSSVFINEIKELEVDARSRSTHCVLEGCNSVMKQTFARSSSASVESISMYDSRRICCRCRLAKSE
ncbi:hypothetical protein R1flu_009900 [Riccia fluitans]|uniref:Uncharacterized protein n=1 Tax=Riccia fluitans TaxID=41844 RepID=A0ABD1Z3F3_9MARC